MQIIVEDKKLGKKYMLQGHDLDWEVFKESKGKKDKDGNVVGEGGWTSMRIYPTSLPYAVYKVMALVLADPDDHDEYNVKADRIRADIGKVINERLDQLVASVMKR